MPQNELSMKQRWEGSFAEQIARQAYNTAPVEAVIRSISYFLRERFPNGDVQALRFLEMGCGAGPNLIWLAQKGIEVSGIDISPTALSLARENLEREGFSKQIGVLQEGSVTDVPLPDASFDGIIEACVFQHLDAADRRKTFREVSRLLKPGGLFVGYMLADGHTVYQKRRAEELPNDPGTLVLEDGSSKFHLTNIGLSHFYRKEECRALLPEFSVVDPCLTTYYLPEAEARKRGYASYLQSMWTVYAVK